MAKEPPEKGAAQRGAGGTPLAGSQPDPADERSGLDNEKTFFERWMAVRAEIVNSPSAKLKRRKGLLQALFVVPIGLPLALILAVVCEQLSWPRSIYGPALTLIAVFVGQILGDRWATRE
jgi:hypothetical protein